MKKILSLLLVLAMMMGLLACGAKEEAAPAATEAATEAALVVDTKILKEADDNMLNTYSAIAVNPEAPFEDTDGSGKSTFAKILAGCAAANKVC